MRLHMHIRAVYALAVELDHGRDGRDGARSGAGCPPSEISGVNVHV